MINLTLFKKDLKSNIILFVIFAAIITMYGVIVVDMFNPNEDLDWLEQITKMMPELMAFLGFNLDDMTNYQLFIAGYLYDMLFILLGLIFTIMLTNRLVFRYLDQGSFVYLISTPNSRTKILLTQLMTLVTYLVMICSLMFIIIAGYGSVAHTKYVDVGTIIYLDFSFFLLLLFISSITVCASSLFEGKAAFGLNIGVPTLFFVFKLIGNLGGKFDFIKYLTPFSLFNPRMIIDFSPMVHLYNVILLLLTVAIYSITIIFFKKRDLSI